jgi:hypothetical protein
MGERGAGTISRMLRGTGYFGCSQTAELMKEHTL